MISLTHIGFANLLMFSVAKPLGVPINTVATSFCAFGAMLPDIDTPTSALGRIFFPLARIIEGRWGHRTITHSLLSCLVLSIFFLPLAFLVNKIVYISLIIGYFSHLIIDMANPTGVAFFYPSLRRCVFPYIKNYPTRFRIQTASGAEFVLLGVIVALLIISYPVGQFGFRRTLHTILKNPKGAVYDYREIAENYTVKAEVSGIDRITAKHFKGVYPVIGVLGMSTLIIRKDGKLYSLGLRDDCNLVPKKIKCMKDQKIAVITQEIDMSSRLIDDIQYFLDPKKEQYLYGALELKDKTSLPYDFTSFNPVYIFNGYLMLNMATWDDIVSKALGLYVSSGKITIKTLLKQNETFVFKDSFGEKTKLKGGIYTFSFKVDTPDQVLIRKGDRIEKGQIIAEVNQDISDIEKDLEMVQKEKASVLALKKLFLTDISLLLQEQKEKLLTNQKEIKVMEELKSENLITDIEYQKQLDEQRKIKKSIRDLKRDYKIKQREFDVKIFSLEQKLLKIKKEKQEKEAEMVIISKVSGVVANIIFGEASSKIPVTVSVIMESDEG